MALNRSKTEPTDAPALPSTDSGTIALLAQIVSSLADVRLGQTTLEGVVRAHRTELADVRAAVEDYDARLTAGIEKVTTHSPHSESFAVGAVTRQAEEVKGIRAALERLGNATADLTAATNAQRTHLLHLSERVEGLGTFNSE